VVGCCGHSDDPLVLQNVVISLLAENLLASKAGLCAMELNIFCLYKSLLRSLKKVGWI
jgi:hypothetical protein